MKIQGFMQELRVLAQLSKEKAFIDAIKEGRDLHKMVASMMFGIPENEVTKEQRTKAKTIGFGR
jgi:DNA polymerase I